MRVRLVDPNGPLWTRRALPLVSGLLLAIGALGIPLGGSTQATIFLAGMALLFLGPLLTGRRRARNVDLTLGPGHVNIRGAGLLNQRIRGRKVRGASTAYLVRGVGLVLQDRGRPVALELEDEADADAVRDALGIGHHGFGKLGWATEQPQKRFMQWCTRVMGALSYGLLAIGAHGRIIPTDIMAMAGIGAGLVTLISAVRTVDQAMTRLYPPKSRGIDLEPRGVVLREPRSEIPYGAILDVETTRDGITIVTAPQFYPLPIEVRTRGSLTQDERAHCVGQILAAVRRARGLGPREPLVSGQIEDLARGADDARAWLQRLDALAQQMTSGAGYRAAAVDQTELWAALENHEADVNVRAAAARVLARTDKESRKRIQTIAESAREKNTEKRIRIVLEPDVDEVSRELDELDGRILRAAVHQSPPYPDSRGT